MILDNFVIRIYRRDRSDPRLMVGIVEEVGSRKKRGFTTFEELREILLTPTGRYYRYKHMKDKRKCTPGGL
jgi:hypothetical protein